MKRVFWFSALVVFILTGCDQQRVFEANKDFKARSWSTSDTTQFDFRIANGDVPYNIQCNIRNSIDYPYARIFVNYVLQDSLGNLIEKKLVSNYLFDLKTGQPFGQSGIGDIYDHRFSLLENYELKPGLYRLALQQFMREDTLRGVLAAGVRVERAIK